VLQSLSFSAIPEALLEGGASSGGHFTRRLIAGKQKDVNSSRMLPPVPTGSVAPPPRSPATPVRPPSEAYYSKAQPIGRGALYISPSQEYSISPTYHGLRNPDEVYHEPGYLAPVTKPGEYSLFGNVQ